MIVMGSKRMEKMEMVMAMGPITVMEVVMAIVVPPILLGMVLMVAMVVELVKE